jgi:hypothetical protein
MTTAVRAASPIACAVATARCSGLEITTVGCFAANACASRAASAIPTRSSGGSLRPRDHFGVVGDGFDDVVELLVLVQECGDHRADGDDAQSVGPRGLDGLVDENRCEAASLEGVVNLGVNEHPSIAAICERRDSDGLPADGDREFLAALGHYRWRASLTGGLIGGHVNPLTGDTDRVTTAADPVRQRLSIRSPRQTTPLACSASMVSAS